MDTLYRIHTEAVNLPGIRATVAAAFPGFTLIEATGYWAGIAERSLIIEIIGTRDDARGVRDTARRIRDLNAQQAVLVTTTAIGGELIIESAAARVQRTTANAGDEQDNVCQACGDHCPCDCPDAAIEES